MSDTFHPGDVVHLKSGSPPMTVLGTDNSGMVAVTWFEAQFVSPKCVAFVGTPYVDEFPEICLEDCPPDIEKPTEEEWGNSQAEEDDDDDGREPV